MYKTYPVDCAMRFKVCECGGIFREATFPTKFDSHYNVEMKCDTCGVLKFLDKDDLPTQVYTFKQPVPTFQDWVKVCLDEGLLDQESYDKFSDAAKKLLEKK